MFFCEGSSEAPVLMFFCFLNEGWKDGNGKSAFLSGDNFEVLDFTERIRKEPSRKVVEQFNISFPDTLPVGLVLCVLDLEKILS